MKSQKNWTLLFGTAALTTAAISTSNSMTRDNPDYKEEGNIYCSSHYGLLTDCKSEFDAQPE